MAESKTPDQAPMGPQDDAGATADEQRLIDFVIGRCDEPTRQAVRERIERDPGFAALHDGVRRALDILGAYAAPEPPDDLADRTLARVRAMRRTESLLDRQRQQRRTFAPLLSMRELTALAAAAVLVVGILVPSVREARRRTQRDLCAAHIGQIGTALGHYASGNDESLPAVAADAWLPGAGRRFASHSTAMFVLSRAGYAPPEVFQCPAAGGRSFNVRAGMSDFPSAQNIGYSWQHSLGEPMRRDHPDVARAADRMVVLADATPVFQAGTFRRDRVHAAASDNHDGQGQNVLFLTGPVVWVTGCRVGVDGNNIWLAEGVFEYAGSERPMSLLDTFLLPNANR